MFHGRTVYYCSDRGGRTANLWAYDLDKKTQRQVTTFAEYDVKWPSVGSDAIVFENGGWLWVMDLPGEEAHEALGARAGRQAGDAPRVPHASPTTSSGFDLSPSAKRAVLEARGELFSVPGREGRGAQPDEYAGGARARPGVVARRQVDRLPLRRLGRVPDPRRGRRRQDAGAAGDEGRRDVPLRAALVAGLEEAAVLGQDRAAALGRRGDRRDHDDRPQRRRRDPRSTAGRATRSGCASRRPTPAGSA